MIKLTVEFTFDSEEEEADFINMCGNRNHVYINGFSNNGVSLIQYLPENLRMADTVCTNIRVSARNHNPHSRTDCELELKARSPIPPKTKMIKPEEEDKTPTTSFQSALTRSNFRNVKQHPINPMPIQQVNIKSGFSTAKGNTVANDPNSARLSANSITSIDDSTDSVEMRNRALVELYRIRKLDIEQFSVEELAKSLNK